MVIKIENPEGSTSRGVSKSGKAWESVMKGDYGYFAGSKKWHFFISKTISRCWPTRAWVRAATWKT
jgi:hypothetical protein